VTETNNGFAFWSSRTQQQEYVPVEQDRQGRLEYNDDLTADLGEAGADVGTVRVRRSRQSRPPVPGFMSPLEMNPPTPSPRGSQLELVTKAVSRDPLGLNIHVQNENMPNHLSYDLGRNKPAWELPQRPDSGIDRTSPIAGPRHQTQGRVVSRSGTDIGDHRLGYLHDDDDTAFSGLRAGLRGRNVSGKVAEEGLGGF